MQSRRSRTRPSFRTSSANFALLEVGSDSTRPVSLRLGEPHVVSGEDGWEVKVTASGAETIEVRASGRAAVRVNDVQVRGLAHARTGDLVALPDRSLLVQRFSSKQVGPPPPASHEAFAQRLADEATRDGSERAPFSVLVVRSRAFMGDGLAAFLGAPEVDGLRRRAPPVLVGQAALGTLEFLCPGARQVDADVIREQLSEALGRLGRPFRWGWASFPSEALHGATLWGRALDRLFAERIEPVDELPHVDPVMVRLWALCDAWAGMKGGLVVQGELGSGRETLGHVIHERRSPQAPFVVFKSAVFEEVAWRTAVDRARGGTLYVRHLVGLPSSEAASFWQASAFRPMAGAHSHEARAPGIVVAVPALHDRPLDVLPIAEHVLTRCAGTGTSRKLKLTSAARSMLSTDWTGSVRELKNAIQLAALLVDASGEVLPEHLASSLTRLPGVRPRETNLRASLRSLERRTFLEALGRTNWNVTQAAKLLGLPRRTIVYRMSRLGLKRPASSG